MKNMKGAKRLVVGGLIAATLGIATVSPASAIKGPAPGDPFDCGQPCDPDPFNPLTYTVTGSARMPRLSVAIERAHAAAASRCPTDGYTVTGFDSELTDNDFVVITLDIICDDD